ncbi:MAG: restriction endonuclease [Peptococcaceae bacterium BRH_c4b]|nr:MAG: restriction endonuclease [Peptococcaceae bacterium BRH_c4b]
MSIVLSDRIYTVEDYMKLDDGRRYELIGGELILVPSPKPRHQRVANELNVELTIYLRHNPIGEVFYDVDVHFGGEVVAPDVLFISKEKISIIGESNIQGAPDLVVEVLSPSTASIDRKKKSKLYFANGVKEYWVVAPDQQLVEVFIAGEKEWRWIGAFDQEDVLTTALLPGLEIRLCEVFKGIGRQEG